MPDAIELSSDVGLVAVGLLTANILLGLLVSTGYNPVRRWPRRRIKLFKLHNWTGYTALAVAALHPVIVLFSKTAGFVLRDVAVPLWSPVQPLENSIGAAGLYLAAFAVLTSYLPPRVRISPLEAAALHHVRRGGDLLHPQSADGSGAEEPAGRLVRRGEGVRRGVHPARRVRDDLAHPPRAPAWQS